MKHIAFIWIPMLFVALFIGLGAFVEIPMPYEGAIFLLGASITGYTGLKSFSVFVLSKELPKNEAIAPETQRKFTHILIALYIIVIESIVVQFMKPSVLLPLNELLIMAGISTGIVLAGTQAVKLGKSMGEGK
jgi:hypothetical protein